MKLSFADIRRSLQIVDPFSFKHAIGIDIGTSSIKIVQLRKEHKGIFLESYGEVHINKYIDDTGVVQDASLPFEQIGGALSELMHDILISSTRAGVSIPTSATLVFPIQLLTRDPEQIRRLIPSEAQKYIPMPLSEVLLDWLLLPSDEVPSSEHAFDTAPQQHTATIVHQKLLVAAMQKEKVRQYEEIMRSAHVSVRFFEIEMFSGARATLSHSEESVLLIDLGASTTKLSVVEHGYTQMLHTAAVGGADITKAPQNELLLKEINFTLSKYQEQEKKSVTRAILIGGGARIPGIDTYLQEALHIPVEIARPFSRVTTPVVLEDSLHDNGPIFANALGLALRALQTK